METAKGPDSNHEKTLIKLIDQYQIALLQMCYMYLHDKALAEDAVQETFLKAYKSMNAFRGDCSEKTWLMRIAVNTCRDMRRSAWFRHVDQKVEIEDVQSSVLQIDEDDDAEEVAFAVVKLPVKYKEVILLYYYQDMTLKEIADALGIGISSVSERLKTARAKLRKVLEKEGAYGR